MEDNDTLREILGFFVRVIGSLMDPIGLPCYIAIGIYFRSLAGALSVALGFRLVFQIVIAIIRSNIAGGVDSSSPDFESLAVGFSGAAFATGITYFFASKYRKAAKDERKTHDMTRFTQEQITAMRGFLPHEDGRVICARLRLDYNPGAPEIILPGDDEDVRRWASVLCKQGGAIPVYIWRESACWEYVGEFEVESFSELPADIAHHARSGSVANIPISSVIRMRRVLTK
jgi:hypothetical protein